MSLQRWFDQIEFNAQADLGHRYASTNGSHNAGFVTARLHLLSCHYTFENASLGCFEVTPSRSWHMFASLAVCIPRGLLFICYMESKCRSAQEIVTQNYILCLRCFSIEQISQTRTI